VGDRAPLRCIYISVVYNILISKNSIDSNLKLTHSLDRITQFVVSMPKEPMQLTIDNFDENNNTNAIVFLIIALNLALRCIYISVAYCGENASDIDSNPKWLCP
jgi:hypothetical protein